MGFEEASQLVTRSTRHSDFSVTSWPLCFQDRVTSWPRDVARSWLVFGFDSRVGDMESSSHIHTVNWICRLLCIQYTATLVDTKDCDCRTMWQQVDRKLTSRVWFAVRFRWSYRSRTYTRMLQTAELYRPTECVIITHHGPGTVKIISVFTRATLC